MGLDLLFLDEPIVNLLERGELSKVHEVSWSTQGIVCSYEFSGLSNQRCRYVRSS